ncbi:MAG: pilus assembly protein TadG-related protein [Candidatus Sericytochromatia bacterium]
MPSSRYRSQRGQVIPYVAFLILILTAAALVVFDIGYLINSRIQSQNAADAAALAAVAVKIDKHHLDSLMRAAMTQEAIMSQAEIRAAQAVALQAFLKGKATPTVIELPGPDNPNPAPQPQPVNLSPEKAAYRQHANGAYKHAVKLQRERLALQAWYRWLARRAPTAVREAARVGYALNMQGYDDLGDATLRQNIESVLADNSELIENKLSGITNVEGFIYADEAARVNGMFGKSFVEIKTRMNASEGGAALLSYLKQFELTSSAAAQLLRREGDTPLTALSYVAINWYSPHLMAIEDENPVKVGH